LNTKRVLGSLNSLLLMLNKQKPKKFHFNPKQFFAVSNDTFQKSNQYSHNFVSYDYLCCKYFRFSIVSFFRISKLCSAESCPDISQRCNGCLLHQRPLSFAYVTLRCKIHSLKLANSVCVNVPCQISA
jgi:hypothetical protein